MILNHRTLTLRNDSVKKEISEKSIVHKIAVVARAGLNYSVDKLKTLNLKSGQHNILLLLLDHDGVTQNYISQHLLLDKGGIARNIYKLEQKDYIYREKDAEDPRNNLVYITEKTKKLRNDLMAVASSWIKKLIKDFSTTDLLQLKDLLTRLEDNARTTVFPMPMDCDAVK